MLDGPPHRAREEARQLVLRLEERERRYAQAYDEHNRKEARNSVDARLTELLKQVLRPATHHSRIPISLWPQWGCQPSANEPKASIESAAAACVSRVFLTRQRGNVD